MRETENQISSPTNQLLVLVGGETQGTQVGNPLGVEWRTKKLDSQMELSSE